MDRVRHYRIELRTRDRQIHSMPNIFVFGGDRITPPSPIPLPAIAYLAFSLFAVAVLAHLPLLSIPFGVAGPILTYVVLPGALTFVMATVTIDGRAWDLAVADWLRYLRAPRMTCGGERIRR
jgi:hypothetical protein